MAKIKLEVSKLENPTAEYISLVSRGANRIPFRIIKQHPNEGENMINIGGKLDLGDIRNVLKSEGAPQSQGKQVVKEEAPDKLTLAGIVVEKSEYLTDAVKKELTDAGIDMANPVENDDGTVTFVQGGTSDDVTVVKMSDHMLALVAGFNPEILTKGSHAETLYNEAGFLMSPDDAVGNMQVTTRKAISESTEENREAVHKQAVAMSTDTAFYVKAMNTILPAAVYKADSIMQKACAAKVQKADADADVVAKAEAEKLAKVNCPACDGAKCNVCDTGKVTKEEAEQISKAFPFKKKKPKGEKPMAAEGEVEGKPAAAKPCDEDTEKKADTTQSQEDKPAATVQAMDATILQKALAEALAPIQKGLTDLTATVGSVQKAQEVQASELTSVKAKVSKAESLMKGTIIGAEPAADHQEQQVVKREGELGAIDTAYNTNIRNRVHKGFVGRLQDERRMAR